MESKNYDSKSFLHEYFRIPRHIKTKWCVIEENVKDEQTLRLGLWLCGTKLYLDVARRLFFTACKIGNVERRILPAIRRVVSPTEATYFVLENPFISLTLPKSYIKDIYYPAIYSDDLLDDELY